MNPILQDITVSDGLSQDMDNSKSSAMRSRQYSFASAYSRVSDTGEAELTVIDRMNSYSGSQGENNIRRRRNSAASVGSLLDEVVENVRNAEEAITTAVIKETRQLEQQVRATMLGHRTFHIAWTMYVLGLSFFGGLVISQMTGLSFIDCLFHATSAVTGSGLQVIGSNTLPKGVFIVSGLLLFAGGSCFMLLPMLIYRCICLRKFMPTVEKRLKEPDLDEDKRIIIDEYRKIYYGSQILAVVILLYIFWWYIFGTLMLLASLHRKPMEPQLAEREFTFFDNALFITVSGFSNGGMTLSTNSLVHIGGNSPAVFVVTSVILAGNILVPVFLRCSLEICLYLVKPYDGYRWIAESLQYVLDNPRKITTHLFDRSSTLYLFQIMLVGKLFLFLYFLVSNWYRESLVKYGDLGHVAGLGLFQVK